jgi:hypothetical protein
MIWPVRLISYSEPLSDHIYLELIYASNIKRKNIVKRQFFGFIYNDRNVKNESVNGPSLQRHQASKRWPFLVLNG